MSLKRIYCLILAIFILLSPSIGLTENSDEGQLVSLLQKSLLSYQSLKDYRAIFVKKERDGSKLGESEKIYFKFEKPFKVFMKWLNTGKKGLEVLYERGKHKGQLAIHKPGLLLGLAPVVFLDPQSPWVREGSASYDIEDVGIGTFLNDFSEAVSQSYHKKDLQVKWLSENQAEVTFLNSQKDSTYFAYQIRVSFDPQTNLPTKMELLDWEKDLIGIYEYSELQLNAGQDAEFKKEINRHLLKIYSPKDTLVLSKSNFAKK